MNLQHLFIETGGTVKSIAVILAAAGQSSRFQGSRLQSKSLGGAPPKKVFATLAGKPIWMYSAEAFSKRPEVRQIILVIAPEDRELFNEKFAGNAVMLGVQAVIGGKERAESVLNGLQAVDKDIAWVAVHDAARPCLADNWIDSVFAQAEKSGAAILAVPCHATLKHVDDNRMVSRTVPREQIWMAQTPQVFAKQILLDAYQQRSDATPATDEAALVEATGQRVAVVEGSPLNIKVTTQADMKFAELALKALPAANPFSTR